MWKWLMVWIVGTPYPPRDSTESPEVRAFGVVLFAIVVGIVGGWLFPWGLIVLPIVFVWCVRRYYRQDR